MSLDMDNLGSAPDIDNFDPSKMDRGDTIVTEDVKGDKLDDDAQKIVD